MLTYFLDRCELVFYLLIFQSRGSIDIVAIINLKFQCLFICNQQKDTQRTLLVFLCFGIQFLPLVNKICFEDFLYTIHDRIEVKKSVKVLILKYQ